MKPKTRPSSLLKRGPFGLLRRSAAALATQLVASHAQAHFFCVSTSTELQGALNDASDGGQYDGEDNYIAVVQGTYLTGSATGNAAFQYHSSATNGELSLEGGYDAGCVEQTRDAALTVLDGNHLTQVLSLRRAEVGVTVMAFTIQNGEATLPGAGLSINATAGNYGGAFVQGNVLRNNHTTAQGGGMYVVNGTDAFNRDGVYIRNNVIAGNSAEGGYGAGMVFGNGGDIDFDNNTVTRNTTTITAGVGGMYFGGTAILYWVDNNIFWSNTNTGLFLGSNNVRMEYNDSSTQGGATPFSSIGNVALVPTFVDAVGGNFHLTGTSALLARSPEIFNGVDPDGHLDPLGGKMDVGAYNETIFFAGQD